MEPNNIKILFYRHKIKKKIYDVEHRIKNNNHLFSNVIHFLRENDNPRIRDLRSYILNRITTMDTITPAEQRPFEIEDDDFKKVYKDLAFRLHPDRPDGDTVLFQGLNDAYNTNNICKILEIIVDNNLDVELPKTISRLLKKQYLELKRQNNELKNHWINQWDSNQTDEEKFQFLENLKIDI
jgi:hypothetical protein